MFDMSRLYRVLPVQKQRLVAKLSLAALGAAALSAVPVAADDSLSVYTVDETVVTQTRQQDPRYSGVAAKVPILIKDTPASVGVVGPALLRQQAATVLGDALRNVAGVTAQTGFGVFDFFTVRGFDSLENGLVLTDGIAEPEVSFYQLYNVERVEVLKGPGAFLYGGSPLAGAVNLARKQPQFGSRQLRWDLSYGSFASLRSTADANWSNPDRDMAFRVNALLYDADQYRDDKPARALALNPAVTWRPDIRTEVKFNFEYADTEYRSDAGLPIVVDFFSGGPPTLADVPRTRSYQSPYDLSEQQTYRLRVEAGRRLSEALSLRGRLYYTDLDWISRGTLFNGVFPNATGGLEVSRTLTLLDDRQRFGGVQLEALYNGATGGLKHQLLAGVELGRQADEFTQDVVVPDDPRNPIPGNVALPGLDLFNPVESAPPLAALTPLPPLSSAADARSLILAPYLVDRIEWGEQLALFVGGRFDVIDYEDEVTGTQREYKKFSPMGGVVFKPRPQLSLYASGGQAFAPPSTQIAGDREAEESLQLEAGAKVEAWEGRLRASVAAFKLEKSNIAVPDGQGLTRQSGDQESSGFELELAASPTPDWQLTAGYALTTAELTRFAEADPLSGAVIDRSGNDPAFAPRHIFHAWLDRRLPAGFAAGLGGRYVGAQYIAADNAYRIDGTWVFDAALGYEYGPWDLRLNLKNATDSEYETRGFGALSVIPAEPLAVYFNVAWSMPDRR